MEVVLVVVEVVVVEVVVVVVVIVDVVVWLNELTKVNAIEHTYH